MKKFFKNPWVQTMLWIGVWVGVTYIADRARECKVEKLNKDKVLHECRCNREKQQAEAEAPFKVEEPEEAAKAE